MERYSHVKGLSVISLAEGKKLGAVEDVMVDAQGRRVRWLRIHSGSTFERDYRLVPVEAVTGVGQDLVTIRSEQDVRDAPGPAERQQPGEAGQKLIGSRVVTEDGRFLGEIRDFEFDPQSFELGSFLVRQGNFLSTQEVSVPAAKLMTVGTDVVVVGRDVAVQKGSVPGGIFGRSDRPAEERPAGRVEPPPAPPPATPRRGAEQPEMGRPAPAFSGPEDQQAGDYGTPRTEEAPAGSEHPSEDAGRPVERYRGSDDDYGSPPESFDRERQQFAPEPPQVGEPYNAPEDRPAGEENP